MLTMGEQKYLGRDMKFFSGGKSMAKKLEFFCKEKKYSDLLL